MLICDDVVEEAQRLIAAGAARNLTLRLLGGIAIRLHCPSATHRALTRVLPDIDLVVPASAGPHVEPFLAGEGYSPNKTFNTLSGARRQLYYDLERNRQVDVFIGCFEMCHKLPIADRLQLEPLTVPLAELFLSKAQIVTLNPKDVLDLLALLLDHAVGATDDETINADSIAGLCAKEWGLYTTVSLNVQRLRDILAQGGVELDQAQKELVLQRLGRLQEVIDAAPKSAGWKLRARLGTRVRWYDEVEEVQR